MHTILQMVSAERVMQYGKLQSEAALETLPPKEKPPSTWPAEGGITMDGVSFRYADNLPVVLNNVSLCISPSEKVLLLYPIMFMILAIPLSDTFRHISYSHYPDLAFPGECCSNLVGL